MARKIHSVDGSGALRLGRDDHNRTVAIATCSQCEAEHSIPFKSANVPAQAVAKKFAQAGWVMVHGNRDAVCPSCARPPGEIPRPTLDAHRAQREMHRLLEAHFLPDEHRFADGWSDERVAAETGLSVQHVVEVRSNAYGAIADPELTTLRDDLVAAEVKITEDRRQLEALLRDQCEAHNKLLADLQRRLTAIETRNRP